MWVWRQRYAEENVLIKGFGSWVEGLDLAKATVKKRSELLSPSESIYY